MLRIFWNYGVENSTNLNFHRFCLEKKKKTDWVHWINKQLIINEWREWNSCCEWHAAKLFNENCETKRKAKLFYRCFSIHPMLRKFAFRQWLMSSIITQISARFVVMGHSFHMEIKLINLNSKKFSFFFCPPVFQRWNNSWND